MAASSLGCGRDSSDLSEGRGLWNPGLNRTSLRLKAKSVILAKGQ